MRTSKDGLGGGGGGEGEMTRYTRCAKEERIMTWDVLIETPSGWKVPNGDIDLPSALKRLSTRAAHVHGALPQTPQGGTSSPR